MAHGGRAQENAAIAVAPRRGVWRGGWPFGFAPSFGGARERLQRWLLADAAAGRRCPWLPIAFVLGVFLYSAAEREPDYRIALALAAVLWFAVIIAHARP